MTFTWSVVFRGVCQELQQLEKVGLTVELIAVHAFMKELEQAKAEIEEFRAAAVAAAAAHNKQEGKRK